MWLISHWPLSFSHGLFPGGQFSLGRAGRWSHLNIFVFNSTQMPNEGHDHLDGRRAYRPQRYRGSPFTDSPYNVRTAHCQCSGGFESKRSARSSPRTAALPSILKVYPLLYMSAEWIYIYGLFRKVGKCKVLVTTPRGCRFKSFCMVCTPLCTNLEG